MTMQNSMHLFGYFLFFLVFVSTFSTFLYISVLMLVFLLVFLGVLLFFLLQVTTSYFILNSCWKVFFNHLPGCSLKEYLSLYLIPAWPPPDWKVPHLVTIWLLNGEKLPHCLGIGWRLDVTAEIFLNCIKK